MLLDAIGMGLGRTSNTFACQRDGVGHHSNMRDCHRDRVGGHMSSIGGRHHPLLLIWMGLDVIATCWEAE